MKPAYTFSYPGRHPIAPWRKILADDVNSPSNDMDRKTDLKNAPNYEDVKGALYR